MPWPIDTICLGPEGTREEVPVCGREDGDHLTSSTGVTNKAQPERLTPCAGQWQLLRAEMRGSSQHEARGGSLLVGARVASTPRDWQKRKVHDGSSGS